MRNHFRLTALWLVSALLVVMVVVVATLTQSEGVRAQVYSSTGPHGFFTSDTGYCALCHDVHGAPGKKLLSISIESEVCFTCHNGTGSNYNTRMQLNLDPTTNAMHPIVVDLENNAGTYQYTAPRTTAGIAPPGPYECSQCHNPHGASGFPQDLRAQYSVNEYITYPADPDPYGLCWTCHNTSQIVQDEVYFNRHTEHIILQSSPCTTCHYSSHGVPYGKLVNFNRAFVTPLAPNANPVFTDLGPNRGSCTLTCHGVDHLNLEY